MVIPTENPGSMLSLKRKLRTRKRHSSSSSSSHGSVSDLDDRMVMLCENMPSEGSYDSESQSPEAHTSCKSQSGEFELSMEQQPSPEERDKMSYRMAYYTEMVPAGMQAYYYYIQRGCQVYGCSMLLLRDRLLLDVTADVLPHHEYLQSIMLPKLVEIVI